MAWQLLSLLAWEIWLPNNYAQLSSHRECQSETHISCKRSLLSPPHFQEEARPLTWKPVPNKTRWPFQRKKKQRRWNSIPGMSHKCFDNKTDPNEGDRLPTNLANRCFGKKPTKTLTPYTSKHTLLARRDRERNPTPLAVRKPRATFPNYARICILPKMSTWGSLQTIHEKHKCTCRDVICI